MKKMLAVAAAVVLLQAASSAQAGISFNINVGGPPIVVAQPPDFLYPPELGFGVAVGVPYDMFYFSGAYFIFRGGGWYRTDYYGGPWIKVRPRELPPEFRRYRMHRIREFRDREYRVYSRDRGHYGGRYFRPGGEEREMRHDMRDQRRDEHRDMKEMRRDEHQQMKEQRREEHQQMKDERREMKDERREERGGDRR